MAEELRGQLILQLERELDIFLESSEHDDDYKELVLRKMLAIALGDKEESSI